MLKIWLTEHRRQFMILGMVMILMVGFSLGWYAGINTTDRKAYVVLWKSILDIPDPEKCALCSNEMRCHAPCLLDLATGEMGEMKVYTDDPTQPGEIAPAEMQQTGTFNFQNCAGLTGIRDTCGHTCQVSLPVEKKLMNPALFCRECRQLLAGVGLEGYAILDLYNSDSIQAYPIRNEVIRDYRVSVGNRKDGRTELRITGLLEF